MTNRGTCPTRRSPTSWRQQWLAQIQGKVLDDLIDKTADAIRGSVDKATMVRVLKSLQLEKFQANVAHAPGSGAGATRGP